jgi:predicted RNase H-like HicB family nuclease
MSAYRISLHWSEEDDAFIAEVPELPGFMADGPTAEAALANCQKTIELWIDTAKELGRPVPAPAVAPSQPQEPR